MQLWQPYLVRVRRLEVFHPQVPSISVCANQRSELSCLGIAVSSTTHLALLTVCVCYICTTMAIWEAWLLPVMHLAQHLVCALGLGMPEARDMQALHDSRHKLVRSCLPRRSTSRLAAG